MNITVLEELTRYGAFRKIRYLLKHKLVYITRFVIYWHPICTYIRSPMPLIMKATMFMCCCIHLASGLAYKPVADYSILFMRTAYNPIPILNFRTLFFI